MKLSYVLFHVCHSVAFSHIPVYIEWVIASGMGEYCAPVGAIRAVGIFPAS